MMARHQLISFLATLVLEKFWSVYSDTDNTSASGDSRASRAAACPTLRVLRLSQPPGWILLYFSS